MQCNCSSDLWSDLCTETSSPHGNNQAKDLKKTEEAIYSYLDAILCSYQTNDSLQDDNTRWARFNTYSSFKFSGSFWLCVMADGALDKQSTAILTCDFHE